jgi:hypothetical protein
MFDLRIQLVTVLGSRAPGETNPARRLPEICSTLGVMHPWSKAHGYGCNDRAVCKTLSGKRLEVLEAVTVRRSVKFHHNAIESARVTKNDADSAGHV